MSLLIQGVAILKIFAGILSAPVAFVTFIFGRTLKTSSSLTGWYVKAASSSAAPDLFKLGLYCAVLLKKKFPIAYFWKVTVFGF